MKQANTSALKRFARELLTTTCLAVAATGVGQAATINESGNFGSTDQFGGTLGTVFALPAGTDRVQGGISPTTGDNDFFAFSGLTAGPFGGVVPGDGVLVVQLLQIEQVAFYDLTLTAQTAGVPEPATVATVGLGLAAAGLAAHRRKNAK